MLPTGPFLNAGHTLGEHQVQKLAEKTGHRNQPLAFLRTIANCEHELTI